MWEALSYPFFQRALLAGVLASVACGIIGTLVVVKKMSSYSGGLAHAVFGGIGLGHFFGVSPMGAAFGFGMLCSLVMGVVYRVGEKALDTLISIVWSVGMALGVIFISLTPGYAPDLNSYLFGSILFVPLDYLVIVGLLDLVIVSVVGLFFKEFSAVAFDEEFSEIVGIPVMGVFLAMLLLIACAVITLIRIVGIILTIALLTLPAVIAKQWCGSLRCTMLGASVVAMLATTVGLFSSYWFSEAFGLNVPSGPLVIILLAILYGVSCFCVYAKRTKRA